MELEVTWRRVFRLWWALFWRSLLAIAVAFLISGVIGFVMGLIGIESEIIMYVSGTIGAIIGFGTGLVPIKLILNKNYGGFRLALVPVSWGTDRWSLNFGTPCGHLFSTMWKSEGT